MAKNRPHFFTEADKLIAQDKADAFGPVSGATTTKYRVWSRHKATTDPKAIAVTDGFLFAAEIDGDAAHVNLVFKPKVQRWPFLPNIFCFVYKRVKKSTLLTVDGKNIGPETNNDITKKLHEDLRAFYTSKGPEVLADWDGKVNAVKLLPWLANPDTAELRAYYRETTGGTGVLVKAGDYLGDFDKDGFGLEITMERWGMEPTVGMVRKDDHRIEVAALTGSETAAVKFKNELAREAILDYLDPAAFYGAFYGEGTGDRQLNYMTGGVFEKARRKDLYDAVIDKFYHKNTVYLDLRNTLNYSMNLFGNLADTLSIAPGTMSLSSFNYRRSSWPLLALKKADFAGKSDFFYTYMSHCRVELLFPVDENLVFPDFFTIFRGKPKSGSASATRGEFVRAKASESAVTTFDLLTPKFGDHLTKYTPVANYMRVVYSSSYFNGYDEVTDFSTNIHLTGGYLDQLFLAFHEDRDFEPGGEEKMIGEVYYDQRMVPWSDGLNTSFVGPRGITVGTEVVTFFAYPTKRALKRFQRNPRNLSMSSFISADHENLHQKIAGQYQSVMMETGYLEFDTRDDIPFHRLIQPPQRGLKEPDVRELITLTLTRTEYEDLRKVKNASGFLSEFPVYFGTTPEFISEYDKNGRSIVQYNLVLRGLEEDAGEIKTKEVDTEIIITYTHS